MLIYNIKTQVEFDLAYNALIFLLMVSACRYSVPVEARAAGRRATSLLYVTINHVITFSCRYSVPVEASAAGRRATSLLYVGVQGPGGGGGDGPVPG